MARASFANTHIPPATESVPYGTNQELTNGLFGYMTESFVAEVVGAGGVGGSFVCPFEPATIEVSEVTGPTLNKQYPGSSGPIAIDLIDGTAGVLSAVAPVDADDLSQGFTVTLLTALAPDGDTATVLCQGFTGRDSL